LRKKSEENMWGRRPHTFSHFCCAIGPPDLLRAHLLRSFNIVYYFKHLLAYLGEWTALTHAEAPDPDFIENLEVSI
jgi:hypothetical protein